MELVVQILRTADVLLRESREVFRAHGISPAQFNVLNVLADHPEGLSQREISDILVVDRSNVTGLIDRMSAAGWVRREAVPGDRRAWRVRLTPAGRALWKEAFPDYAGAVGAAFAPIGATEGRQVLAVLKKVEARAPEVAAAARVKGGA